MTNEQKLLKAFNASDTRGRDSILQYAVSMAEDWPAPRDESLCGVGRPVDASELVGGELDDIEPATVVRPTV